MPLTCYLPNDSLTTIGNKGIYVKKTIRNAIMDESKITSEVIKKFNIIISLLLDLTGKTENISVTAKVQKLIDMGLTPAEIADILGKPTNYVTAVLTKKIKKKRR